MTLDYWLLKLTLLHENIMPSLKFERLPISTLMHALRTWHVNILMCQSVIHGTSWVQHYSVIAHFVFRLYAAYDLNLWSFAINCLSLIVHHICFILLPRTKFVLTFPVTALCDLVALTPNCASYVVLCDYSTICTTQYENYEQVQLQSTSEQSLSSTSTSRQSTAWE